MATAEEIVETPEPGFCSKTSRIQLFYSVWVNMSIVNIGLTYGFSAVAVPQLTAPDSSIHISISDESWIASVVTLACPIGCLICGILMDRYGRRLVLMLCEVPMILGWLYIGFSHTAKDIIIGRVLVGIGCGMTMGPPRVYATEISMPNMRGVVGAFPNLALSIGLSLQALLGSFLKWNTLCYVCACYCFTLFCLNYLLPETPYFVLMKDTPEKARINLQKFRAKDHNIDSEMKDLIEYKAGNDIRRLKPREVLRALFKASACKPFWIITAYVVITQLCGVTIISMYTVEMLEESDSSVDAHLGNVLISVSRFGGGIVAAVLLYKIGRKPLSIYSGLGIGISALSLSAFLYSKSNPSFFPLLCYMAFSISASLGFYTVPMLLMSEIYPLQVRGILTGATVALINLQIFTANKCYPFVKLGLGFANTITAFGVSSLLGCILLYFILPETKGLSLQEIEEFYNRRRPTLVSSRQIMSAQLMQSRTRVTSGSLTKGKSNQALGSKHRLDKEKISEKDKKEKRAEVLAITDSEESKDSEAGPAESIRGQATKDDKDKKPRE